MSKNEDGVFSQVGSIFENGYNPEMHGKPALWIHRLLLAVIVVFSLVCWVIVAIFQPRTAWKEWKNRGKTVTHTKPTSE